jgi:hypothetical protein
MRWRAWNMIDQFCWQVPTMLFCGFEVTSSYFSIVDAEFRFGLLGASILLGLKV